MKYLLDTHVAKWALDDDVKLSENAKSILGDTSLQIWVSLASAWEIAIKISVGKLSFEGGSKFFIEKLRQFGVEILHVNEAHIATVEKLPLLHRDPFDRILISTAIAEGMTIITADESIQKYDVSWIW
ncbi:MAG: type II toxin-antitoxin system VapC family toxin [Defluviitaleaceae bacterium]|nr:type II toxin-antitoxin system VapC family toxin [Defluviitaleaceae bacterium]